MRRDLFKLLMPFEASLLDRGLPSTNMAAYKQLLRILKVNPAPTLALRQVKKGERVPAGMEGHP